MLRIRIALALLTLAVGGMPTQAAGAEPAAPADATSAELAAMLGGRIIGAAKACGVNAERVRRTSERLMSVVGSKASSAAERENTRSYFALSQATGSEQVRSERSKCSEIHVSFSEMEVKLGRAPGTDNDLPKRGIPALGALKPDPAAGIIRQ